MRLAFVLYKYFPYGGMQRDFRTIVEEIQRRGHYCRVYYISWQGDPLPQVDLRRAPVRAWSNHRRNERFLDWVQSDLAEDPVDGVVGFNKAPGLDVYFAADPCYLELALADRGPIYRWGGRFRHFAGWERAVFDSRADTQVLLLSESQRDIYREHYQTPLQRLHVLPPGVTPNPQAQKEDVAVRRRIRENLGLENQELTLLFVGSGFITKGLDRVITALATMREEQPSVTARLLIVGQDKQRRFSRLAKRLGVADKVEVLGGRDDVPELMQGADVLVHPALSEAGGIVLLEAIVAGLPVIVTDVCGYAHFVDAARDGVVLPSPFSQQDLDRAVMRCIDGVYRAECRRSALLYARLTDLDAKHQKAVDLILELVDRNRAATRG